MNQVFVFRSKEMKIKLFLLSTTCLVTLVLNLFVKYHETILKCRKGPPTISVLVWWLGGGWGEKGGVGSIRLKISFGL